MRVQTPTTGLRLIATYKFAKAVLQVAAAVLLFYGAAHGLNARLADFAEKLREHAVHAWSNLFAAALIRFTHSKHSLTFTAYALLADAGLSSVEGWAIFRGHTWGEWGHFHPAAVTSGPWLALSYLGVVGSLAGFGSYVFLLKHTTPARASTYAFVNPLVAVFLGTAVAGEAIGARTGAAALLIVSAVAAVIWGSGARRTAT